MFVFLLEGLCLHKVWKFTFNTWLFLVRAVFIMFTCAGMHVSNKASYSRNGDVT